MKERLFEVKGMYFTTIMMELELVKSWLNKGDVIDSGGRSWRKGTSRESDSLLKFYKKETNLKTVCHKSEDWLGGPWEELRRRKAEICY